MVPPLTLCAYMKKGPNFRWSLIQCSGGDEGDRTPDLLTASQALSQLSYAPVRRSTIRELGRRCKDNFGKTFGGAAPGRPFECASPPGAEGPAGGRRCRPPLRHPNELSRPALRFRGAARHAPGGCPTGAGPIIGPDRASAHPAIPKPCRITGPGREPPSMPELAETKPQVEGSRIPLNAGYGRPVWVQPRNPAQL